MKYLSGLILVAGLAASVRAANVAGAVPPAGLHRHVSADSIPDLAALLPVLNAEQRGHLLDYAHYLGAYYGKSLEKTIPLLDAANQARMARYAQFLHDPASRKPTTVHWNFDTLRFAPIEEGTILMDSFVVTNTGTAPYVIREVKNSCDCTVLSYPKFPLMPGDSETVRIEFDSIKKGGRQLPAMILYDNSRPNRRSILYLEGEVIPKEGVKIIYKN